MDKPINARLYQTDDREEPVFPAAGVDGEFTLDELQKLVGGNIEVVDLRDGRLMVIDEKGKLKSKPVNKAASKIALGIIHDWDQIVGDAVVIRSDQMS